MPAGKQPIHVWINGVEFRSLADAYAEISANTPNSKHRAREAMNIGGTFVNYQCQAYRLSLEPLEEFLTRPPSHVFGEPLLTCPDTHRLGISESRY